MKFDRYTLILLACFSLNTFAAGNPQITGTVVGVADGDTLSVLDSSKREYRVRLAEIDAPESSGQAFGNQAKHALSWLCYRKLAEITVHTKDRYGRNVGVVTCDGVNANAKMVESGLAWSIPNTPRRTRRYSGLSSRHASQNVGFGAMRTLFPRGRGERAAEFGCCAANFRRNTCRPTNALPSRRVSTNPAHTSC